MAALLLPGRTEPPDPLISPRARKKSFADILASSTTSPSLLSIGIKEPRVYCGKPAVVFTKKETDALAARYRFSLIGKFSHGRPTMEVIRRQFASFGLKGAYQVGSIDARHVLITLALEEDFTRLWLKPKCYLDGAPMRLFRWSKTFHTQTESSLVPCWITFPHLPVHLYYKSALFNVANLIGKPLKIDDPTLNVTRPSLARVCMELDVSKPLIESVWIAEYDELVSSEGAYSGFWQEVHYESPPYYCSYCYHVGHNEGLCLHKKSTSTQDQNPKVKVPPSEPATRPPTKVYAPKAQQKTAADKGKGIAIETPKYPTKKTSVVEKSFMGDARNSLAPKETEDMRVLLDLKRSEKSGTSGGKEAETITNAGTFHAESTLAETEMEEGKQQVDAGAIVPVEGISIDLPIVVESPSLQQVDNPLMTHPHRHLKGRSMEGQEVDTMMSELVLVADLRKMCENQSMGQTQDQTGAGGKEQRIGGVDTGSALVMFGGSEEHFDGNIDYEVERDLLDDGLADEISAIHNLDKCSKDDLMLLGVNSDRNIEGNVAEPSFHPHTHSRRRSVGDVDEGLEGVLGNVAQADDNLRRSTRTKKLTFKVRKSPTRA